MHPSSLGFLFFFFLLSAQPVNGHSWVVQPAKRGGSRGSDLELQRFFCPSQNLRTCQPPAKHGIVLTKENLRPCRKVTAFKPMLRVRAGGSFPLRWAGNGHTNAQSDGTCVTLRIAPFHNDPPLSAFTTVEKCLPYYTGTIQNPKSEHLLSIPEGTTPGQYTILWYWNFDDFVFSSCVDILVQDSKAQSTSQSPGEFYRLNGCLDLPGHCEAKNGANSYCREYQTDECGRSWCQGDGRGDLSTRCPSASSSPPPQIPTRSPATTSPAKRPITTSPTRRPITTLAAQKPVTSTTPSPKSTPAAGTQNAGSKADYLSRGCGVAGLLSYCEDNVGSYCRKFQADSCGRHWCHGHSNVMLNLCGQKRTPSAAATTQRPTVKPSERQTSTTQRPTVKPSRRQTTTTRQPQTSTAASAAGSSQADSEAYLSSGCADLPRNFCSARLQKASYCRTFQKDACGRSWCQGEGLQVLSPCPSNISDVNLYKRDGCDTPYIDGRFCRQKFGEGSFCRKDVSDRCGRFWCHRDTPSKFIPCEERPSFVPAL